MEASDRTTPLPASGRCPAFGPTARYRLACPQSRTLAQMAVHAAHLDDRLAPPEIYGVSRPRPAAQIQELLREVFGAEECALVAGHRLERVPAPLLNGDVPRDAPSQMTAPLHQIGSLAIPHRPLGTTEIGTMLESARSQVNIVSGHERLIDSTHFLEEGARDPDVGGRC